MPTIKSFATIILLLSLILILSPSVSPVTLKSNVLKLVILSVESLPESKLPIKSGLFGWSDPIISIVTSSPPPSAETFPAESSAMAVKV